MKRFLTKHGILVLSIAAAVMVILSLVTFFSNNTNALTNVVNVIASPFRSLSTTVSTWIDDQLRFASDYDALQEENQDLKEQIAELERQLRQAQADSEENATLRQLLGLRAQRRDFVWESARITERDASNWASTMQLNVGTDYDVAIGDCVITAEGYLVGSITDAGSNWSTMITVVDATLEMGALLSRTESIAILEGDFTLMAQGRLKLTYLPESTELLTGDLVLTSGLGGNYPSDLVVGSIESIHTDASGMSRYAVIAPSADLDSLVQVFIIKEFDIVE